MKFTEKLQKKAEAKERKEINKKIDNFINSFPVRLTSLVCSVIVFWFLSQCANIYNISYIFTCSLFAMILFMVNTVCFVFSEKILSFLHKLLQTRDVPTTTGNPISFFISCFILISMSIFVKPFQFWLFNTITRGALILFFIIYSFQIYKLYENNPKVGTLPTARLSLAIQILLILGYLLYQFIQGVVFVGVTFSQWLTAFPVHVSLYLSYSTAVLGGNSFLLYTLILLAAFVSCYMEYLYARALKDKIKFTKQKRYLFKVLVHTVHFSIYWHFCNLHTVFTSKILYGVAPLLCFLLVTLIHEVFWDKEIAILKEIKEKVVSKSSPSSNTKEESLMVTPENITLLEETGPITNDLVEKFTNSSLQDMAKILQEAIPETSTL